MLEPGARVVLTRVVQHKRFADAGQLVNGGLEEPESIRKRQVLGERAVRELRGPEG